MAIPNTFAIPGLAFVENGTSEVRIPRGMLLDGIVLSGAYTDAISAAATAARTHGVPIQLIQLITDGGKVLQSWRPDDLARNAQVYEQTALANLLAPPTALAVGNQTGTFDLVLDFAEPFATAGRLTALATWLYDDAILRVTWGSHAQVYVGGAGAVTMQSLSVVGVAVQQDFRALGDPFVWARKLARRAMSFKEVAAPGAANGAFPIELNRTADYRAIAIQCLDANGQSTDGIINSVSLIVDNNLRQFNAVPYRTLRSRNARVFGVQMPTGMCVLEFAEDRDISHILQATKFTDLSLSLDVSAVAGTIRVVQAQIEAPPAGA